MDAESAKDITLMDKDSLEIPVQVTSTRNAKNRRRKARRKARKMNSSENIDNMNENLEISHITSVANNDSEKNLLGSDMTVPPTPAEQHQMYVESTKELSDMNAKIKKAVVVKDEVQTVGQNKIVVGSTENHAEGDVNRKRKRRKKKKKKKPTVEDEVESMDQANGILNLNLSVGNLDQGVDIDLTENKCIAQESEISLSKKSLSPDLHNKESMLESSKCEGTVLLSNVVDTSSSRDSSKLVEEGTGTLKNSMELDGKFLPFENKCIAQESEISLSKESLSPDLHNKENMLESSKREGTVLLSNVVDTSSSRVSSKLVEEGIGTLTNSMELDGKFLPFESQHGSHPNRMAVENLELVSGLNEVTAHLPSSALKEAECLSKDLAQCPSIGPNVSIKRKLLVLDVNGLLAYIVMPAPKECSGDTRILGRAIFRRPFCDDFLKFCFLNFDVGIWSSRSKKIIDKVVDYLLGDLREKLLFCWDMEHSTQTGFRTLENKHKPLVFKELRKIWENDDPSLPWKKGDYDESNTLLLDDSPYKALLNPLHTAIFPRSYHYEDKNDNSLGPGGDLRVYLEGVLASVDVQKYVGLHPFGQSAITETNLEWGFYSGVLQTMADRLANTTLNSQPL